MRRWWNKYGLNFLSCLGGLVFHFFVLGYAFAEVNVNILAVNATESRKEKEIKYKLPQELTADDILDTAGLKLDYDINEKAYFVVGKVNLEPKESRTLKVKIRDVWKINPEKITDIKNQIDISVERFKGSEQSESADKKREELLQRLDYIVEEQTKYADSVEKRIDQFRTYSGELDQIRLDAISVTYWRAKPGEVPEDKYVKFVVEVENPLKDKPKKVNQQHYLPEEVRQEHIIDLKGFELHYDSENKQSYLSKEEELKPAEKKRYEFEVLDIWRIPQPNIEDLKDRTRETYKLLENTEYANSAAYLVASIKENLAKIDESQSQERSLKEHISEFRINSERFEVAKKDVEALEDLLRAVRENLERSLLKNVLKRVQSLKSLAAIAKALFNKNMPLNTMLGIIIGVVGFVGFMTVVNFIIWGRRSKTIKIDEHKEEVEGKEKKV
ncbi:MAG: hypothetical protein A2Y04_04440 [Omnitrophica WOR_2 bacterium GWC2_45_7]|uniref:Uncharacterized protein n=1 Tax=candidate division CPR1 bacterium GW2011_GWA2_42_17 TaxID=1618341 RepID=A0A0G1C543_9BACT|nr:MAG: hypothetical protein UV05_C0001G0023 [candidate division CPR1 bacterium GW2011_GWA2_42_17]OGX18411.1 MAG: hypothetical protein A2Y04_04440 [Omnitrophica WOR_2 bacterium GWC2_45_7]